MKPVSGCRLSSANITTTPMKKCTYPNCKCTEVRELIEIAESVARRLNSEFTVDLDRLARTPICEAKDA